MHLNTPWRLLAIAAATAIITAACGDGGDSSTNSNPPSPPDPSAPANPTRPVTPSGGNNPSGDNPSGDNPSGDNPSGDNPSGDNPSGDNPSGSDPGGDPAANPLNGTTLSAILDASDQPLTELNAGENATLQVQLQGSETIQVNLTLNGATFTSNNSSSLNGVQFTNGALPEGLGITVAPDATEVTLTLTDADGNTETIRIPVNTPLELTGANINRINNGDPTTALPVGKPSTVTIELQANKQLTGERRVQLDIVDGNKSHPFTKAAFANGAKSVKLTLTDGIGEVEITPAVGDSEINLRLTDEESGKVFTIAPIKVDTSGGTVTPPTVEPVEAVATVDGVVNDNVSLQPGTAYTVQFTFYADKGKTTSIPGTRTVTVAVERTGGAPDANLEGNKKTVDVTITDGKGQFQVTPKAAGKMRLRLTDKDTGNFFTRFFPVVAATPTPGPTPTDPCDGVGALGRMSTTQPATQAEICAILKAHNDARDAENAGLPHLTWNDTIAQFAYAYSQKLASSSCGLTHNPNRGSYGENLWGGTSGSFTVTDAVNAWAREKPNYNWVPIGQGNFGSYGHYTQVIWKNTKQVGCGYAKCNNKVILTCNYSPAGNVSGGYPYPKP